MMSMACQPTVLSVGRCTAERARTHLLSFRNFCFFLLFPVSVTVAASVAARTWTTRGRCDHPSVPDPVRGEAHF